MNWFYGFGIALIALFSFFFLMGFFTFRNANHRRRRYPADRREHGGNAPISSEARALLKQSRTWFDSRDFESVSVTSCDGLRLAAQLLPATEDAKGVLILFHGYHSSCRRDASVQAQALYEAGYHILLVSQRAHGESEGEYICFGVKERMDVLPWCRLAEERFPSLPIFLMGISMGASTVLMSADTSLPERVKGIVADCGFSSPWEIIWRTLRHKHKIPPFPVIYFMNYWSRALAGFDYRAYSTPQALRSNQHPILLIHGTEDAYVPAEMSKKAAQADPEHTQLLLVSGAKHGQSIYYDPNEYLQTLLSFLDRCI